MSAFSAASYNTSRTICYFTVKNNKINLTHSFIISSLVCNAIFIELPNYSYSVSFPLALTLDGQYKFNLAFIQQMHINEQEKDQGEDRACYFCKEADIESCVTRSLYHKYNDSSNKTVQCIDQLIASQHGKQRSTATKIYGEIKHLVDENEHLTKFLPERKAVRQLEELLEYYKYRKFVPIFAKNVDNLRVTEQLHIYYYDKLKIYYNEIKRNLNITIEQSELSQSSRSSLSKSDATSEKSKLLQEFTTKISKEIFKESIRNYETQSKALQNLLNILKKNEDRLKKIKSLRTEDCTREGGQQFKDNFQKKSNIVSWLASENRMPKKGKKFFFRYIEQTKAQKILELTSKNKSLKKIMGEQSKASLYYESIKSRANSESIYRLKKEGSRTNIAKNQKLHAKTKTLDERPQRKSCENLMERHVIKSLPKVQMQFQVRPTRSQSSTSFGHPNHQARQISNLIPAQKQIDYKQKLNTMKAANQTSQKKKKVLPGTISATKTPYRPTQVDQNDDNLASINRRRIEQLKLKSQRRKDKK